MTADRYAGTGRCWAPGAERVNAPDRAVAYTLTQTTQAFSELRSATPP
jgi:hypothetical protein